MERNNSLRVPDVIDDTLRFLINIFLPQEGAAHVRSFELLARGCRNRTSFADKRGMGEVFAPGIACGIQCLLERLSQASPVVSLPEHRLETVGLVLGGIQMVSTYAKDGSAMITVRFKHMIGSVHNAFLDVLGLADPVAETRDHLALQVLSDISMPLLDICAFAELDVADSQGGSVPRLQSIAEQAGEIRFQVELIKRYIHSLDRGVAGAGTRDFPDARLVNMLPTLA